MAKVLGEMAFLLGEMPILLGGFQYFCPSYVK